MRKCRQNQAFKVKEKAQKISARKSNEQQKLDCNCIRTKLSKEKTTQCKSFRQKENV
jgi:hypothetical protein